MQPAPGKPAPCAGGNAERIEELTEEEREVLSDSCRDGLEHKCLRIIDAHAVDRAAQAAEYTKRLEAWEVDRKQLLADRAALVARAEAAERDTHGALEEIDMLKRSGLDRAKVAESECAALRADQDRQSQEIVRLRAEVELLRAENTECRRLLLRRVEATRLDVANAQLAALRAEVAKAQELALERGGEIADLSAEVELEREQLRQCIVSDTNHMRERDEARAEVERLRAENTEARRRADKVERENHELRQSKRWFDRNEELRAKINRLKEELDMQRRRADHHQGAAETLRAEVERLRALHDQSSNVHAEQVRYRGYLEQQLAAKNALLERFKAGYNALPAIPHAGQWKALCVDTMAAIEGWPKEDDAHLSSAPATAPAQPAAPECRDPAEIDRASEWDQPAAQSEPARCRDCGGLAEHPSEPSDEATHGMVEYWREACQVAEQRLTVANALLERCWDEWRSKMLAPGHRYTNKHIEDACKAELARREGK